MGAIDFVSLLFYRAGNTELHAGGLKDLVFNSLDLYWQGGMYLVNLLDSYAAYYSILTAVFFEAIAVSWIYGKILFFSLV